MQPTNTSHHQQKVLERQTHVAIRIKIALDGFREPKRSTIPTAQSVLGITKHLIATLRAEFGSARNIIVRCLQRSLPQALHHLAEVAEAAEFPLHCHPQENP
jgi:hypothetical protein